MLALEIQGLNVFHAEGKSEGKNEQTPNGQESSGACQCNLPGAAQQALLRFRHCKFM